MLMNYVVCYNLFYSKELYKHFSRLKQYIVFVGFLISIYSLVSLGCYMRIFLEVTIGCIEKRKIVAPYFGDGVYIGAKATVLGGVKIGDNAKIGAHALVLGDVLPNQTACGIHK